MLFDVADYPWQKIGYSNFTINIKDVKTKTFVRILWFLIPFIASFIFVILLRKDIHKIFNFLSILGLIFFVLMSYQMFSLKKLYSSFDRQENHCFSQHLIGLSQPLKRSGYHLNVITFRGRFRVMPFALSFASSIPGRAYEQEISGGKYKNHDKIVVTKVIYLLLIEI